VKSQSKVLSMVKQSLEQPEQFFRCDHERWPLCIYNFSYKTVLPQYFVFKAKAETYSIIQDHFYSSFKAPAKE
jgi:hypothetical protein